MGYIKHDAIIVTSWNDKAIEAAAVAAAGFGLQVLGPSKETTNGYRSMLVCPDGSKEGWNTSDDFDGNRAAFINHLKGFADDDERGFVEWVAVSYSDDEDCAKITADKWRGLAERGE